MKNDKIIRYFFVFEHGVNEMHWISVQASSEIMLPVYTFVHLCDLAIVLPSNKRPNCVYRIALHRIEMMLTSNINTAAVVSTLSAAHILAYMWKTCIKKNYTVHPSCLFPPSRCISFSLKPSAFDLLQLLQLLLHFYHIACTHMYILYAYAFVHMFIFIYALNVEKFCVFHVTTLICCIGIWLCIHKSCTFSYSYSHMYA